MKFTDGIESPAIDANYGKANPEETYNVKDKPVSSLVITTENIWLMRQLKLRYQDGAVEDITKKYDISGSDQER